LFFDPYGQPRWLEYKIMSHSISVYLLGSVYKLDYLLGLVFILILSYYHELLNYFPIYLGLGVLDPYKQRALWLVKVLINYYLFVLSKKL
jgi:hypothetical protein